MKTLLLALAMLVAAVPAAAQSTRRERVAAFDNCLDIANCPAFKPYHRPDDAQWGPVYWFVSERREACVVDARTFAATPGSAEVECAWRWPRP